MIQRHTTLRVVATAGVVLGLMLFGVLWVFPHFWGADADHDDALALWESKEPAAYSFTFAHCSGMCASCPIQVTVRDGEVTEATTTGRGCSTGTDAGPTIEDVFAMEEADRDAATTDSFEITYDPTWGFPASVVIRCPDGWSDCGTGYEVNNFRARP